MPIEDKRTKNEAAIRGLNDALVTAIRAKNIDGVMASYAPDLVAFDIVAPLNALETAQAYAAAIAANAPLSVAGSKLILEAIAAGTAKTREAEITGVIDHAMTSADYREGAKAFVEKRSAKFTGR